MSEAKSVNLYFTEGSSDKVYNVQLSEGPDGWSVSAQNGARGKTLKEQKKCSGVSYEVANAEYEKLVKSKTNKGYTEQEDGAVFTSAAMAGRDTGFRPQLYNEIPFDEALDLGDEWLIQQKHDGERRPVMIKGGLPVYANRKGLEVGIQQSIDTGMTLLGTLLGDMELDCEDMGDHVVIFDIKAMAGIEVGVFSERAKKLRMIDHVIREHGLHFALKVDVPVPASVFFANYQKDQMDNGSEGFVGRHVDAIYTPDRPKTGGDVFKVKYWQDVTCRVAEGRQGKRSMGIELLDESGDWVGVGNVTIPSNAEIPEIGALIDVKYLYAYKGGSLFEPTYRRPRPDVEEAECRLDRLKFKAENDTYMRMEM